MCICVLCRFSRDLYSADKEQLFDSHEEKLYDFTSINTESGVYIRRLPLNTSAPTRPVQFIWRQGQLFIPVPVSLTPPPLHHLCFCSTGSILFPPYSRCSLAPLQRFTLKKAGLWLRRVDTACPLKRPGDFLPLKNFQFPGKRLFSIDLVPDHVLWFFQDFWSSHFLQKWLLGHHGIWSHMDTNLWAEGIFSSPVPFDIASCYRYWKAALCAVYFSWSSFPSLRCSAHVRVEHYYFLNYDNDRCQWYACSKTLGGMLL